MKRFFTYTLVLFLVSCEDIIYPDLVTNDPILVVDAWVNNKNETQIIKLTKTQDYLNTSAPAAATGADVKIIDENGLQFNFIDQGDGNYMWEPTDSFPSLGQIENEFFLDINYNGKKIQASSTLNRTSVIDSINFVKGQVPEESYYAEFWSREAEGVGDAYWVKAYKNGQRLTTFQDIITCIDAGASSEGAIIDGIPFYTSS